MAMQKVALLKKESSIVKGDAKAATNELKKIKKKTVEKKEVVKKE